MSLCQSCNKKYDTLIVCPYCTISHCKKCVKSILEKQVDLPECNNCHNRWITYFLKDNLGQAFVKEHVQPKIKFVLWEKEQPFLITEQPLVEQRKQYNTIKKLISDKEMQLKDISREILYLKKQLSDMTPCLSSSEFSPTPRPSVSTLCLSSPTPSEFSVSNAPIRFSTPLYTNPYIRLYCISYSNCSEPSHIDLLLKIDKYAPAHKKKTEEWISIIDMMKKKQRHIHYEPIRNEWRIPYLMKELTEEQYCSKLYDIYKDSEKKQDDQHRLTAYLDISFYLLSQLDIYLENYFLNEDTIRTLFETEEKMRADLL